MLFKNVIKTLGKKWMQLIAIGFIIILSSATYSMMFYALSGIDEPTNKYLEEYNQEDFSIEMFNILTREESVNIDLISKDLYALSDIKKSDPKLFSKVIEDRIKAFTDRYPGYFLELREFKSINFEYKGKSHKALLLKDAKVINRSFIEEGEHPAFDNEICINKIYAQKNNLKIGETLEINGKEYIISGFVLMPDYTFPMFDNSFNVDTGLQTNILMTDGEYEESAAIEGFRLSGESLDGSATDNTFYKYDLAFVSSIISTDTAIRSGAIYDELTQGKAMGMGLSIFIVSIAIIVVSLMIYNLLQAQRGQIGILKALGYKRLEIAIPYIGSIIILAFTMLLIGYFIGYYFAEPLKALYLDFYLLPAVKIGQSLEVLATSVFVPLLFFALVSGVIIIGMLKERALSLIRPQELKAVGRLSRMASKLFIMVKASTKFKYLYALRNTLGFVIFFIGIMFTTILINFSFMADGIVGRLTVDYLKKVDYEYMAYVDLTKPLPILDEGEEKFLSYPYAALDGEVVALEGLSPSNKLYRLYDEKDNEITSKIKDGVVISLKLAMKRNIEIGDVIRVNVKDAYYSFKVKGVVADNITESIYLDISRLSDILTEGRDEGLFSGIYSKNKPDTGSYDISISKTSIIEQSRAMADYADLIIGVMIGGSAMIAIFLLFVLTSLTVESNYYIISLLKVIGYRKKEVNSMILNSYLIFTIISYLVSVPVALFVMDKLMKLFAVEYGIILPFEFKWLHLIFGFFFVMIIFFAGSYISRRKISRIPLQEVLKAYGE